jgi:hypothetical protein
MRDLRQYLLENWRLSLHFWERANLMGAAVAAIFAIPITAWLTVEWTTLGQRILIIFPGVFLLTLMLAVTPFRMWLSQRAKLREHERRDEAVAAKSVSLMDVRRIAAEEFGWDFNSYSDQLIGLMGGLRQAAVHTAKTNIVIEGRKGCIPFAEDMKLNFPLQTIPSAHFIDWTITLPMWSNWDVTTSKINGRDEDCFRDLYVTDEQALRAWLSGPANEYKTPQADTEVRDVLIHMAFYTELDGIAAAVEAFESAARTNAIRVYGHNIWEGVGVVSSLSELRRRYWDHARLDVESFDIEGKRTPSDADYEQFVERWQRTIPADDQDAYGRLRTNKAKILAIWPPTKDGSPLSPAAVNDAKATTTTSRVNAAV